MIQRDRFDSRMNEWKACGSFSGSNGSWVQKYDGSELQHKCHSFGIFYRNYAEIMWSLR